MRFKGSTSELAAAMRLVAPVVGARRSSGFLKFVVAGDSLDISAWDGETLVTVHMTGEGREDGESVVGGGFVADFILKSTDAERVWLSSTKDCMSASAAGAKLDLDVADKSLWTSIQHLAVTTQWTEDDVANVARVLHAADHDGSRPELSGVFIGDGYAMATDRYRLASVGITSTGLSDAAVPAEAMSVVLATASGGPLGVGVSDAQVTFAAGNVTTSSRRLVSVVPPWRAQLVPRGGKVTMSRQPVLQALRRIAVLGDREPRHRIDFTRHDQARLQMSTSVVGLGQQRELVPGSSDFARIRFDGRMLRELFEVLRSDEVSLVMDSPVAPAVVTEPPFAGLISPIRA
jgi:DNA polymerase III sliding clamp (beta) subunit (PCNA family)